MDATEATKMEAAESPAITALAGDSADANDREVPSSPHDGETAVSLDSVVHPALNSNDGKIHSAVLDDSSTAAVQPDSVALLNLDSQQRREFLKHQIEFYFSRENLAQDAFLVSQMDSDQYVAVELIASFNNVRRLVDDLPTLLDVIRESKQLQLDSSGTRVRPMFQRSVVVMREVARDVTEEQMIELFNGAAAKAKKCPSCTSVEYADNGCWYVAFDTQDEAQKALNYVRLVMKTFRGQPVMARLKAVPLARGALAFNRQFLASGAASQQQHSSVYQGSPNRVSPMSGNSSMDISPLHFGTQGSSSSATGNIISKSDSFLPDSLLGEQQQHHAGTLPVRIMPTPTVPLVSTSAPPPSVHLPLLASPHQQHQRQSVDISGEVASADYNKSRRKPGLVAVPFNTGGFYPTAQQQSGVASALQHQQNQDLLAAVASGQPYQGGDADTAAAEAVLTMQAADDYYHNQQQQHPGSISMQWIPGFEHQHHYHHSLRLSGNPPPGSTQSSPLNSICADSSESFSQYPPMTVGCGGGGDGEWSGGNSGKMPRRWHPQQHSPYQQNIASQAITPDDPDVGFVPAVNYAGGDPAAVAFVHRQYMSGNVQYDPPILALAATDYASPTSTNTGRQLQQKCDVVFSSPDDNSTNARVLSDASYFQQQHSSSPYAFYQPQHFGASDSMLLAAGYSSNGAGVYHHQPDSPQQQQWNSHEIAGGSQHGRQQHPNGKRYPPVASSLNNRSPTNHEMAEYRSDVKSQQQQLSVSSTSSTRFNDNSIGSSSTLNPPGANTQQQYSSSSLPASNRRRPSYRNNTMQHDIPSQSSPRFNNNNFSLPVVNNSNRFAHSGDVTSCGVLNCNHRSCNNNINRLPSPVPDGGAGSDYGVQYNFYGQQQHQPSTSYNKNIIMPKSENNEPTVGNNNYRAAEFHKGQRDIAASGEYNTSTVYGSQPEYGYHYRNNKFYNNNAYTVKDGVNINGPQQQQQQYSTGGTDSAVSSLSSSNGAQPPPLSDSSGCASLTPLERASGTSSSQVGDNADEYRRVAADQQRSRGGGGQQQRGDIGPLDRNMGAGRVGAGKSGGDGMPIRRTYYDSKDGLAGYNDSQYAANRYQGGGAKSGSFSDNKRHSVTNEGEAASSARIPPTTNSGSAPYVRVSPSSSNNAVGSKSSTTFNSGGNAGGVQHPQQQQAIGRKPPVNSSPRAAAYKSSRGDAAEFRPPSFELAGTAFPPLPTPDAFKNDAHPTTTESSSSTAIDVSLPSAATVTVAAAGGSSDTSHYHSTNAWSQPKPDSRFTVAAAQQAEPHYNSHHNQRQLPQQSHTTSSVSSASSSNVMPSCWNSSQHQQQQHYSNENNHNRYTTPTPFQQQQQQRKPKIDKCIGTHDMPFLPREQYGQLVKLVKQYKKNNAGVTDVELTEQQQRQNDEMQRLLEELTLGGNVVLANELKRRLAELSTVQKLSATILQQQHHGMDKTKTVSAQTEKCGGSGINHVTCVLRQQSFTAEKGASLTTMNADGDAGRDGGDAPFGEATTNEATIAVTAVASA